MHITGYLMETFSKVALSVALIDATLVFKHCLQICVLTIKLESTANIKRKFFHQSRRVSMQQQYNGCSFMYQMKNAEYLQGISQIAPGVGWASVEEIDFHISPPYFPVVGGICLSTHKLSCTIAHFSQQGSRQQGHHHYRQSLKIFSISEISYNSSVIRKS